MPADSPADDTPLTGLTRDDARVERRETVFKGYFQVDTYELRHRLFQGGWSGTFRREVFERKHAVACLLYDPVRDEHIPSAAPWERGPSTMTTLYGYPVRDGLGFCGLPTRTPIKNLLLAGPHNVPALGMEGLFLAAQTGEHGVTIDVGQVDVEQHDVRP